MDNTDTIFALLMFGLPFILMFLFCFLMLGLKIYGAVLGFRKKWYFGLMALMVPFFGEIVALAKLIFKKDLLKE